MRSAPEQGDTGERGSGEGRTGQREKQQQPAGRNTGEALSRKAISQQQPP